jgi:hypothetical protein
LALVLSLSLSPALHRYPDWRLSKSCCQSSRCPRQPGRQPCAMSDSRREYLAVKMFQTSTYLLSTFKNALSNILSTSSSNENGPLDDAAHGSSLLRVLRHSYRLHSLIQCWPRLQMQRSLAVDIHTHTIGLTWIVKSYVRGGLTISRRTHADIQMQRALGRG